MSRICAALDEAVGALRARRLDHERFPYVYLDATYLHVRCDHKVVSRAVVIATGVREDGHREVRGVAVGDSEDELFWRTFLRSLKDRGLCGVKLVISDQHAGLVAGIKRCFEGAAHQRYRVHFARNLLATVPEGNQEMVAAAFRTIFAQATRDEMAAQWDHVRATFAERFVSEPDAGARYPIHCENGPGLRRRRRVTSDRDPRGRFERLLPCRSLWSLMAADLDDRPGGRGPRALTSFPIHTGARVHRAERVAGRLAGMPPTVRT